MKNLSERTYFIHPRQMEFSAKVVRAEDSGEGRTLVWLDSTCFYPESGGQPADRGKLGGLDVIDVTEDERGVCHLLGGKLEAGDEVNGSVDEERRRDHTVQHSGQHLLSRVFLRMFGLQTVGFHLGEKSSTIDLEGADLDAARIAKAEREANLEVMKDSEIESRIVSRAEYGEMIGKQDEKSRIRSRLPEGVETVRVVEIMDVDLCSCCGTHCGRTGEIGPIKIVGTEKVRGNLRVEFLCGMRAYEDYAARHDQLAGIAAVFTTDWRECLQAVERITEENRAFRREVASLGKELASYRAGDIGEPDLKIGTAEVYKKSFDEAGADEVREMVNKLKSEDGRIILFGIKSPKPFLIFACSEGLGLDMGVVMKAAAGVMGARGGGRGSFAQGGGGDPGLLDEAIDAAVESAREELT